MMSVDSVREVREVDQVSTAVLPYRSKLFAVYVLSRTRLKDYRARQILMHA